jgi:hypothetical protein
VAARLQHFKQVSPKEGVLVWRRHKACKIRGSSNAAEVAYQRSAQVTTGSHGSNTSTKDRQM